MSKTLLLIILAAIVIYVFRQKLGGFLSSVGAGTLGAWLAGLSL